MHKARKNIHMNVDYIITFIKRRIVSSSFFWKLRHFLQPSWVEAYNQKKTPRFYFDFVAKNNISSILDFGCAAGNLLYDLKNKNPSLVTYGIDINLKALDVCNKKFNLLDVNRTTFFFDNAVNKDSVSWFLERNKLDKFDLLVFDRVLYCLNEDSILSIFDSLADFTNLILIDDFELNSTYEAQGYNHRDWISLLKSYNFENKINIPTIYSEVRNANARTLMFQRDDD